jgi:FKBP-type peptidyl-prolyl cis-trans isomerase
MNRNNDTKEFSKSTVILFSIASLIVGGVLAYTLFPKFSDENVDQAHNGDKVAVLYSLKLPNGTELEKTADPKKPFEFVLGKAMVLQGWEETVEGMSIGEKKTVTITSEKAYGHTGVPNENKGYFVPPDSSVILDVELLSIKR